MRRGDVYTAATGGGYGSKPRPVLVVQGDEFCVAPRVIVAIFATPRTELVWPRLLVPATVNNGLEHDSELQIDILMTVPIRQFGRYVGRLEADYFAQAEVALLTLLGFTS